MIAKNIIYDIDLEKNENYEDVIKKLNLPDSILIPNDLNTNEIDDYISDKTGFCHKGYILEK